MLPEKEDATAGNYFDDTHRTTKNQITQSKVYFAQQKQQIPGHVLPNTSEWFILIITLKDPLLTLDFNAKKVINRTYHIKNPILFKNYIWAFGELL